MKAEYKTTNKSKHIHQTKPRPVKSMCSTGLVGVFCWIGGSIAYGLHHILSLWSGKPVLDVCISKVSIYEMMYNLWCIHHLDF